MEGVVGRPTKYKDEYVEQVRKLCLLGATNEQIANFFSISTSTLHEWRQEHEEFSSALKEGKMLADAEVADSLFQRAKGYSCPDLDIKMYEGEIIETPYTKHYPPDATSAIFWLKNRQPELWRDKREFIETESNNEIEIRVVRVSKNKDAD
jgi:hypothetical protein